jgi:hypothetical protein
MPHSTNRNVPRLAQWILLFTYVFGCSGIRHIPLEPAVASTLSGKEVMVVKRRVPDFAATLRDRAPAGILIAPVPFLGLFTLPITEAIATNIGNSIVHENDIHDPAYQIAEEIAASMSIKYGTNYRGIGEVEISGDDDDVSVVSAAYQSVPLVLDVKTLGWGLSYGRITSDQYSIYFRARLRLVNTETREAFVQGFCSYSTGADETASYDELVANGTIRLKEQLETGVRLCVKEFSSKHLSM